MKKIVVTPHAVMTLIQLDDALHKAGDGMLLAKIKRGGTVVLYERTKARKFENPAADAERADRAIRTIEALLEGQPGFGIGDDEMAPLKKGGDTLLKYIRGLADKNNGGAIPASRLRDALPGLQAVLQNLPGASSKGVRAIELGIETVGDLEDFAIAIGRKEDTDIELGRLLGNKLKHDLEIIALKSEGRYESLRQRIAYSSNRFLKAQLSSELGKDYRASGVERKLGWPDGLSERFDKIARAAVDRLAMSLLDNQPIPGTEKDFGEHGGLPHVRINGEVYKPVRQVGADGCYSFAMEYANTSHHRDEKRIVLKITHKHLLPDESLDAVDMAGTEALKLQGFLNLKPSKHVVGLKGVLRFEDGRFGIAMDCAARGSLEDVYKNVTRAVEQGKITKDERRIIAYAMLRELALGLRILHEDANCAHLALHIGHAMVDEDGTVKIGSFGLSAFLEHGEHLEWRDAPTTDETTVMAPEIAASYLAKVRGRFADRKSLMRGTEPSDEMVSARKLVSLLPFASADTQQELTRSIFDNLTAKTRGPVYFDKAFDIWHFGATMLQMLTGKSPGQHPTGQWYRQLKAIVAYDRSNVWALSEPDAHGNPKDGAIGVRTGDVEADMLLERLLHADPKKRPTATQIVLNPIWYTGHDTAAVKSLMIAAADGDMAGIRAARVDLYGKRRSMMRDGTV